MLNRLIEIEAIQVVVFFALAELQQQLLSSLLET